MGAPWRCADCGAVIGHIRERQLFPLSGGYVRGDAGVPCPECGQVQAWFEYRKHRDQAFWLFMQLRRTLTDAQIGQMLAVLRDADASAEDALRTITGGRGETITDGFGGEWPRRCACGGERQVVRPGKVQCTVCGK